MKYLIFSDESGCWNTGKYYIRSWIKIEPKNYNLLRKEIIFSKHETGIKELKWKGFKGNYIKGKDIFNVNFDIFITISKPKHLQTRNYHIINAIKNIVESTGSQEFTGKIKEKLINSIRNELFFNYFEKTHVNNSKIAFSLHKETPDNYKYIIDTPQYLDKEWKDIARELGIKNVEIIKNSGNYPGLELVDIISGCIMDLIGGVNEANLIYQECLKSKMINMWSEEYPNPNIIFYPDFCEDDLKELDIFR